IGADLERPAGVVADIYVAVAIYTDRLRRVQRDRISERSDRADYKSLHSRAGEARKSSVRRKLHHPVLAGIGDVEVSRCVRGYSLGRAEQAIVIGYAAGGHVGRRAAIAGDRADDPVQRDLTDAIVPGVGDVEVTRAVESEAVRIAQCGAQGWAPIAAEGWRLAGYPADSA